MSKFRRWKRKVRNARWREYKHALMAHGWVEVGENTLVPATCAAAYPPYVPTHLRGTKVVPRLSG